MIALECCYILPNGQKCRGNALRGRPFCLHHKPKPMLSGPPPLPKREQYSRLARWRRLGQCAAWLDPAEIPAEILGILDSLLGRNGEPISDLAAGRYLRALLRRLGHIPFALAPALPDAEVHGAPAAQASKPAFTPAPEPARPRSPQPAPFPFPVPARIEAAPDAAPEAARYVRAARVQLPAAQAGRVQAGQVQTGQVQAGRVQAGRVQEPGLHEAQAQEPRVLAVRLRAAVDEVFPNGRPKPGQKIDLKSIENLSRAFIRHGVVPSEILSTEMDLLEISPKGWRP